MNLSIMEKSMFQHMELEQSSKLDSKSLLILLTLPLSWPFLMKSLIMILMKGMNSPIFIKKTHLEFMTTIQMQCGIFGISISISVKGMIRILSTILSPTMMTIEPSLLEEPISTTQFNQDQLTKSLNNAHLAKMEVYFRIKTVFAITAIEVTLGKHAQEK